MWDVVDLIIDETNMVNESGGKNFDVSASVISQIPFFACKNIFFDQDVQRDIEKYIYCKEFGISPYPGSYNEQPKRWVDRAFLIKKALAKREESMINKQNKETS